MTGGVDRGGVPPAAFESAACRHASVSTGQDAVFQLRHRVFVEQEGRPEHWSRRARARPSAAPPPPPA